MRISDWSSDVCSSDLVARRIGEGGREFGEPRLVVIHAEHELDDRRHRRAGLHGDARILQQLRIALRRSEEHTSELQSLMRISYAVFCLKKKKKTHTTPASEQSLINTINRSILY